MEQVISQKAARVIQEAQARRRADVSLSRDSWLEGISSSPALLLDRMAESGALIPAGAGTYVIPKLGQATPEHLPWQVLMNARLSKGGAYFFSGLTALEEHRLTDISSKTVQAVIGYKNRTLESKQVRVGSRNLRAVASLRSELFTKESGVERVRLSRTESYFRSDLERTLVDSLWKPQLFGTTETWMTAWGRASSSGLNVERLAELASLLGPGPLQRLGVVLDLLGMSDRARVAIDRDRFARRRVAPMIPDRPRLQDSAIDRYWRVDFNVPRERLEGWLLYEQ